MLVIGLSVELGVTGVVDVDVDDLHEYTGQAYLLPYPIEVFYIKPLLH